MNAAKEHGVVYTPAWVVNKILDEAGIDGSGGKIIDPACGDGAFLSAVVERILQRKTSTATKRKHLENSVYGCDIDAQAVAACKKRLAALAAAAGIKNIHWNIFCRDALKKSSIAAWRGEFDFIIGNPPYVRIQNLGADRRQALKTSWSFCRSGSTDIYLAFFEMGLQLLKQGGMLGFITPNTWLKTHAAKTLRRYLKQAKTVKTLVDFEHHQLFENITTYSLITILQKDVENDFFSLVKADNNANFKHLGKISISHMDDNNWILCPPAKRKKLQLMQNNGVLLGELADIHVGVTTLADNCYIFQAPLIEGDIAYIKHPISGAMVPVEKNLLRPIVKASLLKNGHEKQHRYILFPYKKISGRHGLIDEKEMQAKHPLAYAYLKSIKQVLDKRDRGKPNPFGWYAFGRAQGLDTSFGKKILTSPMNLHPHFIVWDKPEYTFYSGYCIKYNGNLHWLAEQLNSDNMEFYINTVSRRYQNNYKSFAKTFLSGFPLPANPPHGEIPKRLF